MSKVDLGDFSGLHSAVSGSLDLQYSLRAFHRRDTSQHQTWQAHFDGSPLERHVSNHAS